MRPPIQSDLDACRDLGRKVQEARAQHDEARAKFQKEYMLRFIYARPQEQHADLRAAFDAGYKEEYEKGDYLRRLSNSR